VFVTALVAFGAVKYLINICGETTASDGATGGGMGAGSAPALNSSGGALVTTDMGVGAGSFEGIGGKGKVMGATTGAAGGLSWSLIGGGNGRKRNGIGPACGK
jgi:hypothetical protein